MNAISNAVSSAANDTMSMVSMATSNTLGVFDGWNVSACLAHFFGPKLELLIEEYEHNTNNNLINFTSDGKIEIGLPQEGVDAAAFTLNSMALAAVAMDGVVSLGEVKVTELVINAPIQSFIPGIVDIFPRPISVYMKQLEVDMLGDPFVMGERTRRTYLKALTGADDDGTGADPPPWEGEAFEKTKETLKTQISPKSAKAKGGGGQGGGQAAAKEGEADAEGGGIFTMFTSAANTTKEKAKSAASKTHAVAKSAASKTKAAAGKGVEISKAVAKKGASAAKKGVRRAGSVVGDGLGKMADGTQAVTGIDLRRNSCDDGQPELEPYPMASRVIDGLLLDIDVVNVTMLAVTTMKERRQGKLESEEIKRKEYLCRCLCFVCGITSCWQPGKDGLATVKPKRTAGDATVIHFEGVSMQNTNKEFVVVDDFDEHSYFDYCHDDVGQSAPDQDTRDPVTGLTPQPTEIRIYKKISVKGFSMMLEGAQGLVVPISCPVELVMNVTMRKRLPDFESIGTDVELCMPSDFPMVGVAAIPSLTRVRLRPAKGMNPEPERLRKWFVDSMKLASDKAKWDEALEYAKKSGISDFTKWEQFFSQHDIDQSGGLDPEELRSLVKGFDINLEDKELKYLFEKIDADNNGVITLKELGDYFEIIKPTNNPHHPQNGGGKGGSQRRVGHSARQLAATNWMVGDRVMVRVGTNVGPTAKSTQPGTPANYYDSPSAAEEGLKVATIEQKNEADGTYRVMFDDSSLHRLTVAPNLIARREGVTDSGGDQGAFDRSTPLQKDENTSCMGR